MKGTATALRRRPRLRGLSWLVWRQNRTAFWIGLAVAAAVLVYAAIQHHRIVTAIDQQHLQMCRGSTPAAKECFSKIVRFGGEYQYPMRRPLQVMVLLPLLFGLFLGGPQLAQELESGTFRTVCSQSVTRVRWLAAKLLVPVVMTVVISGTFAAAMTWWWQPAGDVMGRQFPWYQWYPFDGIGPVVVGTSVLMLLIGTVLGLLLRRTVAAMGATLVVGAGVLLALEKVRGHLLPTTTVNAQHTSVPPAPENAWPMADGALSPSGARVSDVYSCYAADHFDACLAGHGRTGHWAEFHPAAHLWPLQLAETGLCLVLAAAVAAVALWQVRRRLA
ncbi:ABC transporter permease [Streptomyces canarius]